MIEDSFDSLNFSNYKIVSPSYSVLLSLKGCSLLATCVVKDSTESGFFVNFIEKFTSINKIPGGFKKREMGSDSEVLITRAIDRSLRPSLLNLTKEIQLTLQIFEYDGKFPIEVLGICAGSVVLNMAQVSLKIISAACLNKNGLCFKSLNDFYLLQSVAFPAVFSSAQNMKKKPSAKICMIEYSAGRQNENCSLEESYKTFLSLQAKGLDWSLKMYSIQKTFLENYFKEKNITKNIAINFETLNETEAYVSEILFENLPDAEKAAKLEASNFTKQDFALSYFEKKVRADGRKFEEIRALKSEVNIFPSLHGSSVFTRFNECGSTQVVSQLTFGKFSEYQIVETLNGIFNDNFILHYNFLPYCVNEIGKNNLSRRDIGHANLIKRSLYAALPELNSTIRLVCDVTSSNGSSSMASVCAGSLALMQAGVKIENHVAGITVGSFKLNEKHQLFVDISALEDSYSEMDFKISASNKFIAAMQLDVKNEGIDFNLCAKAVKLALKSIKEILHNMKLSIKKPNQNLHAIYKKVFRTDKDSLKILTSESVLSEILNKFKVKVDADKIGRVFIVSKDLDKIEKALSFLEEKYQIILSK